MTLLGTQSQPTSRLEWPKHLYVAKTKLPSPTTRHYARGAYGCAEHVAAIRLVRKDRDVGADIMVDQLKITKPFAERAVDVEMPQIDERGGMPTKAMPVFWDITKQLGDVTAPWDESKYLDKRFHQLVQDLGPVKVRMAHLEIDQVSLSYPNARESSTFLALDAIDLRVERGEFVTVVGPSGCGKSSLLMLIAALLHPTSGDIRLNSKPVVAPGPDRALVFQDFALLPWRTVLKKRRTRPRTAAYRGGRAHGDRAQVHRDGGAARFRAALSASASGGHASSAASASPAR